MMPIKKWVNWSMKGISRNIFIYAMVRYTKHFDTEYIIIDGLLEIDDNIIPIQFQINVDKVKASDHAKVFRIASIAFNRTISFNRPKAESKKSWWKIW